MYPKPREGFANANQVLWITPKALTVCKGVGLDIGCEGIHNKLPGALGVDICSHPGADFVGYAEDFPRLFGDRKFDYVFSSHCLEHIENWQAALEWWISVIRPGGIFFLYLPNPAVAPGWSKVHLSTHKHDFTLHMILKKLVFYEIEIMESAYDEYAGFYIWGVRNA
jgi:SAM-dependent methyltransferase